MLSCLAGVTLSAAWADQVVLKNGDRVTGTIVKKDGNSLTIKTDQFGVVTTSWDQVDSIAADRSVTVVLQDGRTVRGTLATAGGRVEIAGQDTKASVTLAEIAALRDADEQRAYERLLKPGLAELWTGVANLGFAGSAGNAKTLTFTTGVNASRTTNTDKTSVYFNAIKASALINGVSASTAEAVRGGLGYDRNVRPRLFVNVFNDWEYDKFQNLDLRFVIGGGFGFHAVKSARSVLDVVGGIDYNRSDFGASPTLNSFSRNSAEFYWGDGYTFKLNEAASLVQSFRMFDDLTNTGAYRVNADLGISTKVAKWLNWTVSLSDRYLSNPVPGRKTNDFLYTTGLGVTFGK